MGNNQNKARSPRGALTKLIANLHVRNSVDRTENDLTSTSSSSSSSSSGSPPNHASNDNRKKRVILLGTGSVGKTTLFKIFDHLLEIDMLMPSAYYDASSSFAQGMPLESKMSHQVTTTTAAITPTSKTRSLEEQLNKQVNHRSSSNNKQGISKEWHQPIKYCLETRASYREICMGNVMTLLIPLCTQALSSINFEHEDSRETALIVANMSLYSVTRVCGMEDFEDLIQRIYKMWTTEPEFRTLLIEGQYTSRLLSDLINENVYFLDRLTQLLDLNHITEDVGMRLKIKTTGLPSCEGTWNGMGVEVFDTGGQRNERKKWRAVVPTTQAVVIPISLKEYYMVCYEDNTTNRTEEAMQLVQALMESSRAPSLNFFFVFTHFDLFKKHLSVKDMSDAFDDLPEELRQTESNHYSCLHMSMLPFDPVDESSAAQEKSKIPVFDLTGLSDDLLVHICTFLHPRHLIPFSLANFHFYKVANSDRVWSSYCKKLHPDLTDQQVDYVLNNSEVLRKSFIAPIGELRSPGRSTQNYKYYFKTGGYMAVKNLEFMMQKYLSLAPAKVAQSTYVVNAINVYETRYLCIKILDFLETTTTSTTPSPRSSKTR